MEPSCQGLDSAKKLKSQGEASKNFSQFLEKKFLECLYFLIALTALCRIFSGLRCPNELNLCTSWHTNSMLASWTPKQKNSKNITQTVTRKGLANSDRGTPALWAVYKSSSVLPVEEFFYSRHLENKNHRGGLRPPLWSSVFTKTDFRGESIEKALDK